MGTRPVTSGPSIGADESAGSGLIASRPVTEADKDKMPDDEEVRSKGHVIKASFHVPDLKTVLKVNPSDV